MTGHYYIDGPIMAVSLFNTILLLWLGLTTLLTAEHRSWGIWLAGGGLLMGGLFFISHTAILGYSLTYTYTGQGLEFWWRVGWVPVVAAPLAWYLVILWYTGFWANKQSNLHRRQRPWLFLTALLTLIMIGLLSLVNPLPAYWQVTQLDLSASLSIGGIPLIILIYPLYILMCIGLALDALRRPQPSERVMGDLARSRARPWLVTTSVLLLAVSLMVAGVMIWLIVNARRLSLAGISSEMVMTVAWFDLMIAVLIAIATLSVGQAIVSYEVFTGKTLPRWGLRRQWYRAIILATGYGLVVGWSLVIQLRPIYGLLLSTLLMTFFYALLSWRSYAERERYIDNLRPFVTSQRLYDHLLDDTPTTSPPEVDIVTPFEALCDDVLSVRLAYLLALGPLAPLVGPPLTYPKGVSFPSFSPSDITSNLHSPQTICLPLDPTHYGGAMWAVPLWSERGLIGLVMLGEKLDGGLFTQEEIEITRASGERLIDTQASVEMARRLMALQRQRMAETQVVDQQTRRVLHDDVLPQLHTTMLSLSSSQVRPSDTSAGAVQLLGQVHRRISDLLRESPAASTPNVARLGLVDGLRHVIDHELTGDFDGVTWQIEPEAEGRTQTLPALTTEVLFYAAREAIRNAARHGRHEPTQPLHLRLELTWHDGLLLLIEDDGGGLRSAGQANGGSGQGLALHSTLLAVIGGSLVVDSTPGAFTRVRLTLPDGAWPTR